MTSHEELMIMKKSSELRKAGKDAEAQALFRTIPMTPEVAMVWKKYVGVEELKKSGWNLSAAEDRYGKDWLDK